MVFPTTVKLTIGKWTFIDTSVPSLEEVMQERYDELSERFDDLSTSISEEEIDEKIDLWYALNPQVKRIGSND